MHARVKTPRFLDTRAHHVLQLKANPSPCLAEVEAGGIDAVSPPHVTPEKGHGRIERRDVRRSTVLTASRAFPRVQRGIRLQRTTWKHSSSGRDEPVSREVGFYLPDLTPAGSPLPAR